MTGAEITDVLRRWTFLDTDEYALQAGIAEALERAGVAALREVRLSDKDRIDFMVAHTGIEVKVAGTVDNVRRQLRRYAEHPNVDALVLVTTRVQLTVMGLGEGLSVPLHVLPIMRGLS